MNQVNEIKDHGMLTMLVPAGMVGVISARTTGDEAHIATVWFELPAKAPEAVTAYWRIRGEPFPVQIQSVVES